MTVTTTVNVQAFAPKAVAVYAVLVPSSEYAVAVQKVRRYLYHGSTPVTESALYDEENDRLVIPIRAEYFPARSADLEEFRSQVQRQRDRFASGLYATTEPTFYVLQES